MTKKGNEGIVADIFNLSSCLFMFFSTEILNIKYLETYFQGAPTFGVQVQGETAQ